MAASVLVRPDALWVIVTLGAGHIWRVDPASLTVIGSTTSSRLPAVLAIGGGAAWVAALNGIVQRIDLRTGDVVRTVSVGLQPQAIAADKNGVWVAVERPS